MIIKEVEAKQILTTVKDEGSWFGIKYNMNIYRGCEHRCIYCDSRSLCYRIDNFHDVIIKKNAIELLRKELSSKRKKGIIGTGAMSDPYTHVEKKYKYTREALKVIAEYGFSVHIITKSDLVTRDIDILKKINKFHASVAFTITTINDELAKKVEPNAPLPSERFKAMKKLSEAGIYTGVTMMPVLPFIEDNKENIYSIVKRTHECGGKYIVPWFGMSLRDRQRDYYYKKLDEYFPGVKEKYIEKFGDRYGCSANNYKLLQRDFHEQCKRLGIETDMKKINAEEEYEQMSFF